LIPLPASSTVKEHGANFSMAFELSSACATTTKRSVAKSAANLNDVRPSARWARRPSPKSSKRWNLGLHQHPSWESGCLGHANAPRGLPKYEATKRLGRVGMRGTPRLGALVQGAQWLMRTWVRLGSLFHEGARRFVWAHGSMKGCDTPKGCDGSQW
jgi:hypothetical protein